MQLALVYGANCRLFKNPDDGRKHILKGKWRQENGIPVIKMTLYTCQRVRDANRRDQFLSSRVRLARITAGPDFSLRAHDEMSLLLTTGQLAWNSPTNGTSVLQWKSYMEGGTEVCCQGEKDANLLSLQCDRLATETEDVPSSACRFWRNGKPSQARRPSRETPSFKWHLLLVYGLGQRGR